MNNYPNIERRDSGPAHADGTGEDRYSQAEVEPKMEADFLEAVYKGVLTHLVPFATISEMHKGTYVKRNATIGEAMAEACDFINGPSTAEVMEFVIAAARKGDADAKKMVERLARQHASAHAEGDE